MESTLTGYKIWNPSTLRKAKDILLNGNGDNAEELQIISYLLDYDCDCDIRERVSDGRFVSTFQDNNYLFENAYAEYVNDILDFRDYQVDKARERSYPYWKLDLSYEFIMARLDYFMESLDDKWYELFSKLYLNRKDIIKLSKDSTETLYLPKCDLWLANVEKTDTIEDYANIARIYGEGIAAKLRRECMKTQDSEVLIRAFARVIQYLFMASLKDVTIQDEINKFFTHDFNNSVERANSIYTRFAINAFITSPKSAKDASNKLKRHFNVNMSKHEIEELYKKSVRRDIQKMVADLIQSELLLTYEEDKEKFIHDMNALVTSEDKPFKTLEKLNIDLNSIYKR